MRRQRLSLKNSSICFSAFLGLTLIWVPGVHSCEINATDNASRRQIIKCGEAVVIERETTAALRIIKRRNNHAPRSIQVQGGAILINVSPGSAPTQIRTPLAIATVRGTTYIVDAGAEQTSVFVLEGSVDVSSTSMTSAVVLKAGEGTDVSLDEPLSVAKWSVTRVNALLARFGR